MRYAPLLETVAEVAGISRNEAERAVAATLATLAERITRGEAEDVAAFLPRELRPLLTSAPEPAEPFGAISPYLWRLEWRWLRASCATWRPTCRATSSHC